VFLNGCATHFLNKDICMNTHDFRDNVTSENVADLPRQLTLEETQQIGGGATLVEYVMLITAAH
jgi:hypothetical protein